MIKNIIFDWTGVIKDSIEDHLFVVNKIFNKFGAKEISLSELKEMAKGAGLATVKTKFYRLEIELEQQLKASFPKPGDADKIRQLVMNDKDGLVSCRKRGAIYLVYPIAIIVGRRVR